MPRRGALRDGSSAGLLLVGAQVAAGGGPAQGLILEIEGETVTEARCGIGYLHTGIEKNLEYR
ncbi:hypothetical protein, partial [Streptomyces nigra]|uniref:hypothetical protein n=1 Tax=Streptomyces nigra TaxID=1827580 RepID=UPI00343808C2